MDPGKPSPWSGAGIPCSDWPRTTVPGRCWNLQKPEPICEVTGNRVAPGLNVTLGRHNQVVMGQNWEPQKPTDTYGPTKGKIIFPIKKKMTPPFWDTLRVGRLGNCRALSLTTTWSTSWPQSHKCMSKHTLKTDTVSILSNYWILNEGICVGSQKTLFRVGPPLDRIRCSRWKFGRCPTCPRQLRA
jgi:hypothetical protein